MSVLDRYKVPYNEVGDSWKNDMDHFFLMVFQILLYL